MSTFDFDAALEVMRDDLVVRFGGKELSARRPSLRETAEWDAIMEAIASPDSRDYRESVDAAVALVASWLPDADPDALGALAFSELTRLARFLMSGGVTEGNVSTGSPEVSAAP